MSNRNAPIRLPITLPVVRDTLVIPRATAMLGLGTVGNTGGIVLEKNELIGTGTGVVEPPIPPLTQETEMRAAPIPGPTGIVVGDLSEGMDGVDVIGPMRRVPQNSPLQRPIELVCSHNGLEIPIRVEEMVLEESEGKDVGGEEALDHRPSTPPLKVHVVNVVEMGVGKVEALIEVVDGEGIGPSDPILPVEDHAEIGAVHGEAADVGLEVPGGVEEEALGRVDDDGPRVRDWRLERPPTRPIELTHFQGL